MKFDFDKYKKASSKVDWKKHDADLKEVHDYIMEFGSLHGKDQGVTKDIDSFAKLLQEQGVVDCSACAEKKILKNDTVSISEDKSGNLVVVKNGETYVLAYSGDGYATPYGIAMANDETFTDIKNHFAKKVWNDLKPDVEKYLAKSEKPKAENMLALYTKTPGQKTYKISDLNGRQVDNKVYAARIHPDKFTEEFKEALRLTAKDNPGIHFQIRDFKTGKVVFEVMKQEKKKPSDRPYAHTKVEVRSKSGTSKAFIIWDIEKRQKFANETFKTPDDALKFIRQNGMVLIQPDHNHYKEGDRVYTFGLPKRGPSVSQGGKEIDNPYENVEGTVTNSQNNDVDVRPDWSDDPYGTGFLPQNLIKLDKSKSKPKKKEATHVYKLGDKYRSDFDYDGMLEWAVKMPSVEVADLQKLQDSFTDVNYHEVSGNLYSALQAFDAGNLKKAKNLLFQFRKDAYKELIDQNPETKVREPKMKIVSHNGDLDDWSRPIYRSTDGDLYVDIDMGDQSEPNLHAVTSAGEPSYPIYWYKIAGTKAPKTGASSNNSAFRDLQKGIEAIVSDMATFENTLGGEAETTVGATVLELESAIDTNDHEECYDQLSMVSDNWEDWNSSFTAVNDRDEWQAFGKRLSNLLVAYNKATGQHVSKAPKIPDGTKVIVKNDVDKKVLTIKSSYWSAKDQRYFYKLSGFSSMEFEEADFDIVDQKSNSETIGNHTIHPYKNGRIAVLGERLEAFTTVDGFMFQPNLKIDGKKEKGFMFPEDQRAKVVEILENPEKFSEENHSFHTLYAGTSVLINLDSQNPSKNQPPLTLAYVDIEEGIRWAFKGAENYSGVKSFAKSVLTRLKKEDRGRVSDNPKAEPRKSKPKKKKTAKKESKKPKKYIEAIIPEMEQLQKMDSNTPIDELMDVAFKIQLKRKLWVQERDESQVNKKVLEFNYNNLIRWATNPGGYDIVGIDAPDTAKATVKARVIKDRLFGKYFGLFN